MNYSLFFKQTKCLFFTLLFSLQFISFESFASLKNPYVELTITGPTLVCAGTKATLTMNGCLGTVNWQPSNFDGQILEDFPTQTTTYSAVCSEDPSNPINHTVTVVNTTAATLPQNSDPFKLCSNQNGATFYAVPSSTDCPTCTYQWIVNGQPASSGTSYSVTNIGTTTVALMVTNNECSATSPTNTVCIYGTTLTGTGTNPNCNASDGIINLGSLNSEGHYVLNYTKDGVPQTAIYFNSSTTGNYTISGLSAGNYVLNVASSGGNSCPTNSITVTLSSDEAPQTSDQTICEGVEAILEATGCINGVISWEGFVGNPIRVNPTITTDYKAICTMGACSGSAFAKVTVIAKPSAPTAVSRQINACPLNTVDISGLISGSNVLYADAAHTGTALTASQVNAISVSGTYYLFNVVGNCFSNGTPVIVRIYSCGDCSSNNFNPGIIVSGSQPPYILCGRYGNITLNASPHPLNGCENCTYQWLNNGIPIATGIAYTVTSIGVSNISVQITKGTCVKTSSEVTVTKYSPTTPINVTRTNACPVKTVSLADLITANTQLYDNINHTGTALTAEQVSGINVNSTFYLFNVENICFSNAATVNVTIIKCDDCNIPNPSVEVSKPCINENVRLGAVCTQGTVIWYNSENVEVSRENPYIVNSGTAPKKYYAKCILGTCLSASNELEVIPVLPLPAPTISSAITFCGGGSTTLTTDCPARVRWWNDTRVIATTETYTTPYLTETTTYYATCQNPNTDCFGAKGSVTITVNQIPTKPADVSRANICPVLTVNISDLITTTTALYDNNTNTGNALTAAVVSSIVAPKTYYLYNVQNNCASEAATVRVTINTCDDCTPTLYVKATPNTICSGDAVLLEKVSGCDNGIIKWFGLTGERPTVYPTEETVYFVNCERADPNCITAASIRVFVNPKPAKPNDKTYTNTCPVDFINISELITANTALYTNAQHSGTPLNSVDVNNLRASGTYYLFATLNDCFSEPATITVNYTKCDNCNAVRPNVMFVGRPCKNNDQLMQITCSVGTPTLYATTIASNPLASFAVNSGTSPKTYYARCKVNETCESEYAEILIDPVDPQTPQIVANPAKICGTGGAVSLNVNCPAIVNWYNAAGNVIGNTNTYNTTISQTTTFSVDCQTPGSTCYNVKVSATIPVIAIPAKPSNVEIQNPCPVLTVNLATLLNGSNAIYDNNMHSGNPLIGEQLVISVSKKLYLFNVNEGCFSEAAEINVIIKNPCNTCDITATTEPNSSSPIAICTGLGGVTFYASPNLSNCPTCTYQWLNNGQDISGAIDATYNVSTVGTSIISVRIQKGTCTSTSTPNTVVIYGNTLTATYIKPSCTANDGSITLASLISNGEYILRYSIDGVNQQELYFTASSTGTYSISNLAAGTYVLTARWTGNAACTTNGITVYLNKTKADEPIATGATICSGQTARLEATGCTGGVLTWNGTTLSTIDVSPTMNTDYTVTCTQGLCTNTKTVTVVVLPKPSTPSNASRTNACPETKVSLADLISSGSQLYDNINHSGTALTVAQVSAIAANGTFYLFNVVNGCFSNAATVSITISTCSNCDLKEPVINSTSSFCINSTADLNANCPNGGTPTWYLTNVLSNPIFSGNPYIINNIGTNLKDYYVTCKLNTTCESGFTKYTITPEVPHPAPTINSTIQNFCGTGGEVTLSTNCPANSTVRWFLENGNFIAAGNTYSTIVNQTTTYKASCKILGKTCDGLLGAITINVNTLPSTPANVSRKNLCPANTVSLADLITATTQLYDNLNHAGTPLTTNQVAALTIGGTYYLFNFQNGCFSEAATVNVTITNCGCENAPILNVSSSCLEKQGQIVATVSNANIGTLQFKLDNGNWQRSGTFYPVLAGNHIVYAQFTNNPACITSTQVNVLDCSCNTTFDVTAICDNAGTSKSSTDDLVRLNINSIGGTGTWAMTASSGGSGLNGTIGTPLTNGYLGNISSLGVGNTINLTFTPNNNPNCAVQKTIKVPAACSPGCNLCFSAQNTKCANGFLTFDLIVSGVGVNDKWSAIRKTTGTSGPTIATGTGPAASGGIPISIKLSDLQNQHGFVLWVMVDGVHDCLGDQYVFIPCNTINGCNISGSFSDVIVNATTNTFTFKVSVVGSGSSNGWVGFYNGTTISGNYGQTVLAGPFPVAGGAVGFGIIDKDNPNCIINVGPVNSKCVGDECADLPNKPVFGSLPPNICSGESVNITAICSNGSPVWYSLNGNQMLTNTSTIDKTYIFRAACKVGNCISEIAETSVIVKSCLPCVNKPTNVVANVSCVNTKGQIVVSASGLNLQYSLNNGAWQSANTFSNLIDGTYTVSVRNSAFPAASCVASVLAVVKCTTICTFPTNINVNITCVNNLGVVTVTATGNNLEYKLNNGLWQSSNIFNNVPQGSHTLYVKMQGCNETEVLVVKVACICIPTVSSATVSKSCINGKGQITITATGTSLLYSIDGGINFQTSNVFNNLVNKDYQIAIKSNSNSCLFYYPSLVNINCPPPCALPTNLNLITSCNNNLGVISVSATGNNLEYKLDNGVWQISSIFKNVTLGSHTVYVRTVGCSETVSKTVNINCSCIPTIKDATVTVKCINDKGVITIAPLGNSILYSIDGGLTFKSSNVFSNLTNGSYKIYIKTSSNPCLYIHPQEVIINCKSSCGDIPCVQTKIIKTKKGK